MVSREKLLSKAQEMPKSLRFSELTVLAEAFGFVFRRQSGSHMMYSRTGSQRPLVFHDAKGMAKPYQIRQLLDVLRELGLIEPKE